MRTIDEDDIWVDLTEGQITTFLEDLATWGPAYDLLSTALPPARIHASILLKRGAKLPTSVDFTRCPIYPATNSKLSDVALACRDRVLSNSRTNYVAVFDYMSDPTQEILDTTERLGGFVKFISKNPVFIFPRGTDGLKELSLYRENFYSPAIGLENEVLFDSVTSVFCNFFDNETFVYIDFEKR